MGELHSRVSQDRWRKAMERGVAYREVEQDMPVSNPSLSQAVTPVARESFNEMLNQREQKGIETYGQSLQTFNGRDAVRDVKEELIDAFQYVTQIEMEIAHLHREIQMLTSENARLQEQVKLQDEVLSARNSVNIAKVTAELREQLKALSIEEIRDLELKTGCFRDASKDGDFTISNDRN